MDQLCDDVLLCIFSVITENRDMICVSNVCKKFYYLAHTKYNLKFQTMRVGCDANNEMIMHLVRGWTELQNVNFTDCQYLTDEHVRLLSELPILQYVDFSGCDRLTDESAKWLSCSRNLQYVDFSWCRRLTDESAK